jgi:hypothetical protein
MSGLWWSLGSLCGYLLVWSWRLFARWRRSRISGGEMDPAPASPRAEVSESAGPSGGMTRGECR